MKNKTIWLAAGSAAFVLTISAGFGGYVFGGSTSQVAQSAYDTGYRQARANYCNLPTPREGTPTRTDYRTIVGLDERLVIADAVCTDDAIRSWNESQGASDSDLQACRYDAQSDLLTSTIGMGNCIAPVVVN